MDLPTSSTSSTAHPLIPSFSALVPKANDPNPSPAPIPVLPSWSSFPPPPSSPTLSSSPSSGSLLSSSPSPETTSRALWAIAHSDPVLAPDLYALNVGAIGTFQSQRGVNVVSPKTKRRKGKKDVDSIDISLHRIGHTAILDDDDPLAVLGGSENVDVLGLESEGKKERLYTLEPAKAKDIKEILHAPQHIACLAPSQNCPHGANCPFFHVHKPSARISTTSTPAFSPEVSMENSSLPVIPPASVSSQEDTELHVTDRPTVTASTSQSNDWVSVIYSTTTSQPTPNVDTTPQSTTPPLSHSTTEALFQSQISSPLPADAQSTLGYAQLPQYRVKKATQLNELGLPIHPLLPPSDLSQYRGFKRHQSGSSGSNRSIDSVLSEFFGEEKMDATKGERKSRRGSLSGKYAVAEIPTWKGSRSPTPSIISMDPPTDLLPLSRILPAAEPSTSKAVPPVNSPLANLESLSPPRTSPSTSVRPSRKERHEERGRSNFSMAIKALGSNPILSIPSSSTAVSSPSSVAIKGPSPPIVSESTKHHSTLSGSSECTTREPISPSLSNRSSVANRSMDPISLFSGPSFTDPTRPLFSGIQRPTAEFTAVHDFNRPRDWWDKQKGKDYRAAQRLERALEEKRLKIVRQLEWNPPTVDKPGYGYGDVAKKPIEVKLESGEVMKVLTDQERRELKAELGRVARELENAREIMNSFAQAFPGGVVPRSLITSPATSAGALSPTSSDMSLQSAVPTLVSAVAPKPTSQDSRSSQASLPPRDAVTRELAMGATPRERVANKLNFMRSQIEGSPAISLSTSKDARKPEVIVRRSANVLDLGSKGQGMGLFGGGKQSGNMLDLLNATMGKTQRPEERVIKRSSNMDMPSIFNMKLPSLADREAAIKARELAQAQAIERPSTSTPQPPKSTSERAIIGRSIGLNLEELMKPRSDTPRAETSSKSIEADILKQPSASLFSMIPTQSRPCSDLPTTKSTVPGPTSSGDPIKHSRRISMSTAKPGEEASTQTMEDLSFDDSSDDDEGDESREYVSASEGYETANDEQQESEWEKDTNEKSLANSTLSTSNAVESATRPELQRKRSSTTIGLPAAETTHRPSPLDNWSFNFSHRLPQDGVSAVPLSPRSAATPVGRYHMRKLSQENSTKSSLFGTGFTAPNNTPSSPPLTQPVQTSPTPDRSSLQAPFPSLTASVRSSAKPATSSADDRPAWNEPYFVVKRSANTMDELGNIIKYATARVMSGGVKIGSIQARGPNDAIPEEEEGRDVVDEGVDDMRGYFVTSYAESSGSSKAGHLATPPEQAPSTSTYPSGVPVPGQPHILSASSEGAHPPIVSPIPQRTASSMTLPHPAQIVAPIEYAGLSSAPATVATSSLPMSTRPPHTTQQGTQTTAPPPAAQPIEYCGDWRTTGHCRFGARCRYSHDIEPRVKTSRNASTSVYRPTVARPAMPPATIDKFPALPPGHRLVNILPQPHHIPGVPVAQQPYSPFVYDTAAAVAHPLTAPAATTAAEQGLEMADKDKASKILRSLGLDPRRAHPNLPAPVVMADGEVRYNMLTPRPRQSAEYSASSVSSPNVNATIQDQPQPRMSRYEAGYGVTTPPTAGHSSVMGSDNVSMNGPEDDIWTVSSGRQMRASIASDVVHGRDTRSRYSADNAILYQSPDQNRAFSPAHPPPSYSPVQHLHHGHQQHSMPTQIPTPGSSSAQTSATLTQEEVVKVLSALGISVPTVPITPVPPYTSSNHGAVYGYPQYYQMPPDPHHRPY